MLPPGGSHLHGFHPRIPPNDDAWSHPRIPSEDPTRGSHQMIPPDDSARGFHRTIPHQRIPLRMMIPPEDLIRESHPRIPQEDPTCNAKIPPNLLNKHYLKSHRLFLFIIHSTNQYIESHISLETEMIGVSLQVTSWPVSPRPATPLRRIF